MRDPNALLSFEGPGMSAKKRSLTNEVILGASAPCTRQLLTSLSRRGQQPL